MRLRPLTLCVALSAMLLGAACSDYEAASYNDSAGEWDAPYEEERPELLLNVHPSDATAKLLPQTRVIAQGTDEWTDLSLELAPSIQITGSVRGWDATPHFDITVPGESTPIAANVSAFVPDTVQSGGKATEAKDGAFAFELPAGADYVLRVIPTDEQELPFLVQTDLEFTTNTEIELDVGYGVGVFGTVVDNTGNGIAGVEVQLIEETTLTEGVHTETDSTGYYFLRAMPGSYTMIFASDAGSGVPTTEQTIVIEEQEHVEMNISFGPIETVTVEGDLLDDQSEGLDDVTVRFTALSLAEHAVTNTLTVETDTDRNGYYATKLLPGHYVVEFIPSYDDGLSPAKKVIQVGNTTQLASLGATSLSALTTLQGTVLSPAKQAVAGVTVTAQQTGFDGYTYSTSTGADGSFTLPVAEGELQITLTPSNPSDGAVTHFESRATAELPNEFLLAAGQTVSGTVFFEGNAVAYALMDITDASGQLLASTLTDAEGAFSVTVDTDMVLVPGDDSDTGSEKTELTDTGAADTGMEDTGDGDTGIEDTGPKD